MIMQHFNYPAFFYFFICMVDLQLGEKRAITHLQYVAWPDHGVPDDPSDFLQFVSSVRERRDKEPLMVHCR